VAETAVAGARLEATGAARVRRAQRGETGTEPPPPGLRVGRLVVELREPVGDPELERESGLGETIDVEGLHDALGYVHAAAGLEAVVRDGTGLGREEGAELVVLDAFLRHGAAEGEALVKRETATRGRAEGGGVGGGGGARRSEGRRSRRTAPGRPAPTRRRLRRRSPVEAGGQIGSVLGRCLPQLVNLLRRKVGAVAAPRGAPHHGLGCSLGRHRSRRSLEWGRGRWMGGGTVVEGGRAPAPRPRRPGPGAGRAGPTRAWRPRPRPLTPTRRVGRRRCFLRPGQSSKKSHGYSLRGFRRQRRP